MQTHCLCERLHFFVGRWIVYDANVLVGQNQQPQKSGIFQKRIVAAALRFGGMTIILTMLESCLWIGVAMSEWATKIAIKSPQALDQSSLPFNAFPKISWADS